LNRIGDRAAVDAVTPDGRKQRPAEPPALRGRRDEQRREEPIASTRPRAREAEQLVRFRGDDRRAVRFENVPLLAREDLDRRPGWRVAVRAVHAGDRVDEQRMERGEILDGRGAKLHARRE